MTQSWDWTQTKHGSSEWDTGRCSRRVDSGSRRFRRLMFVVYAANGTVLSRAESRLQTDCETPRLAWILKKIYSRVKNNPVENQGDFGKQFCLREQGSSWMDIPFLPSRWWKTPGELTKIFKVLRKLRRNTSRRRSRKGTAPNPDLASKPNG